MKRTSTLDNASMPSPPTCAVQCVQYVPAVMSAVVDVLDKYPDTACKKPVEESERLPYSPRPSSAPFASPHHGRIRSSYKSTPPSRHPSGRSVNRKPAEKDSDKPLGRIVDWVSPGGYKGGTLGHGDRAKEQSSKGVTSQEKPCAGMLRPNWGL